jgi:two-component system, cell cycle response regulator CpdR
VEKSLRILYVEDNSLVREVTAELISQEERELIPVSSAEEALAVYAKSHFDLVITDVSLPVMSGLDLARELLKLRSDLPVIVATGYALNFGLESLGPNVRSILKPFELEEIDKLINSLAPAKN